MKKNLVFIISDKCQNNCKYCITKEPGKEYLFSDDFLIKDVAYLKKYLKVYSNLATEISLTGNEPLLNNNIGEIIQVSIENNFNKINIHTNGILLGNNKIFKILKEFKDNIKIVVSLPSTNQKEYNLITNTNNFNIVYNNIKKYIELDFNIYINLVISSMNVKSLPKTIKDLAGIGVKNIQFLCIDTYNKRFNISYNISMPMIEKSINKFSKKIKFGLHAFTPCVIKNYPTLLEIYDIKSRRPTYNEITMGRKALLLKTDYLKISRTKMPICKKCKINNECKGVFKSYVKIFGSDEFKPL